MPTNDRVNCYSHAKQQTPQKETIVKSVIVPVVTPLSTSQSSPSLQRSMMWSVLPCYTSKAKSILQRVSMNVCFLSA
jgi:hypothetical protein